MTYAYYHQVVKGKSPKNAPTYIPEEEEKKEDNEVKKYRCQVCGYVYEGTELPADYKCPICGMGPINLQRFKVTILRTKSRRLAGMKNNDIYGGQK